MLGFLRSRETKFIEENAGKLDAISEKMVAAAIFVRDILGTAQKSWANVRGELATMTSVSEIDERMGPFDFALAGHGGSNASAAQSFCPGQAKRLEYYVLTIVGVVLQPGFETSGWAYSGSAEIGHCGS